MPMKTPFRLFQSLFAIALAVMALGLSAQAASDSERYARVIRVREAKYATSSKGPWKALVVGQQIAPGTWIRTSDNGMAEMRLGERVVNAPAHLGVGNPAAAANLYSPEEKTDNLVHVFPNTIVGIEKLFESTTGVEDVTETKLNLKSGKILGNVKKLSAGSKYEVKLPTGVAGIRGSTYVMSSDGTITMLSGSASITMLIPVPGGGPNSFTQATLTINAGQTFNPASLITAVQQAATAAAASATSSAPAGTPPAQIAQAAQQAAVLAAQYVAAVATSPAGTPPPAAPAGTPPATAAAAVAAATTALASAAPGSTSGGTIGTAVTASPTQIQQASAVSAQLTASGTAPLTTTTVAGNGTQIFVSPR